MQSESIRAAVAAAVFLLAGGVSHAQNKCIDEKGRVTYQSDPCPGASARIRTPAEIGRGVPAPAPTPAPAARAAETAQQAERNRAQCERAARQIAEGRAALPQLPPNLRAQLQKDLAKGDREYAEACAR